MPPTRSRPGPSTAAMKEEAGGMPRIERHEIQPIIDEVISLKETRKQRAAQLRERRLRELYHMICISQAELDGQTGAVADMRAIEDDGGWDAFEIKHKLVESGSSITPLVLPDPTLAPTVKPPLEIIPSSSPPAPSPIAPSTVIGQPPHHLPIPVVDSTPSIVQSEDVETEKYPRKVSVVEATPSVEVSGQSTPITQPTINPKLLEVRLPRYTDRLSPTVYTPRMTPAKSMDKAPEYHPSLYPPAGTGALFPPPTPPGGEFGGYIGVREDHPLTPEDMTLMPLEGDYARELHPLPPPPPRRPRAARREAAEEAAVHHGPHLTTSVAVQATIPPRSRESRSSSPTKDGLIQVDGGMAGSGPAHSRVDLYKLNVGFNVNPVSKMLHRSNKCVTSKEWQTAWEEIKFMRAMERVEQLKQEERWSFRQPKKFRGPIVPKSHWDWMLDEMRWMQADFREERTWKMAAAYEVAEWVRDWHEAAEGVGEGSKAELSVGGRAWGNGGINSMLGRPGPSRAPEELHPAADEVMEEMETLVTREEVAAEEPVIKEEEDETIKMDVDGEAEAEEATAAEEAAVEEEDDEEDADGEVDDSMEVPEEGGDITEEPHKPEVSGLAPGAVASTTLAPEDATPLLSPSAAKEARLPLLSAGPSTFIFKSSDLIEGNPTLDDLFPDLPVYTPPMPHDVKSDKRVDESSQWAGRLVHTSRLMDIRPVLVSTLQPSKYRHPSGRWDHIDDGSMYDEATEYEEWMQTSSTTSQNVAPIFSGKKPKHDLPVNSPPSKPKQADLRSTPLEWEDSEDAVLHELVQDYPYNWILIADLFNSSRVTISTDERTPWDCYDRWNRKFGPESKEPEATASIAGTADPTKGLKIGTGVSPAPGPSTATSAPPTAVEQPQAPLSPGAARRDAKAAKLAKFEGSKKKVRIHCLREAMRRIQKRRDLVNKKTTPGARAIVNVHESHHPFASDNRVPPTPMELSHVQHENAKQYAQQLEVMRLQNMENHRRMQAQRQQAQQQAGRMQQQQQQVATSQAQMQQLQQAQQAQMAGRLQPVTPTEGTQVNGMPMVATNSQPGSMIARPPAGLPALPAGMSQAQLMQLMRNNPAVAAAMRNGQIPNGVQRLPNGIPQGSQAGSPVQNMMHQQLPAAMQQQMMNMQNSGSNRGAASPASSTQGTLQGSPQIPHGQVMQRPQSAASQQSQSPQTNGRTPMPMPNLTNVNPQVYAQYLQQQAGSTPEDRVRQIRALQVSVRSRSVRPVIDGDGGFKQQMQQQQQTQAQQALMQQQGQPTQMGPNGQQNGQ